jgi:CheY-like chemotaxis protein
MARILICEPHADVRSLLASVVCRIGHEPVLSDGTREQALDVDAILLEPGATGGLELATWARERRPQLPVVCASVFPPSPEAEALRPDAYVLKPFPLHELEQALASALGRRVPAAG